ncbi:MAG: hypothetical protein VYC12_00100 [Candidatus Thermoplasmatota archaeon]|nr:hypothetical protein [Candidatus Thermoplasmatota archaeon]
MGINGSDLVMLTLVVLIGVGYLLIAALQWYFGELRWVSKWEKLDKLHDSGKISIEEYGDLVMKLKSDCPDGLWGEVCRLYDQFSQNN